LEGLANDANGTFQDYIKVFNKKILWINFENPCIGLNIILQYTHMYDKIQKIQKKMDTNRMKNK
jgi:hypothetical protein